VRSSYVNSREARRRAKAKDARVGIAKKVVVVDTNAIGTRSELRVKRVDARPADGAVVAEAIARAEDATEESVAGVKSMAIKKHVLSERSGAIEQIAGNARVAASAVSVANDLVAANNARSENAEIEANGLRAETAAIDRAGVVAVAVAGNADLRANERTFASVNSKRIVPREIISKRVRSLLKAH
jgi:hypothetical protein